MNCSSKRFGFILSSLRFKKHCSRTIKLGVALTTASFLIPQNTAPVAAALENSPKTVVDEVWQIINSEYVDPDFNHVDWKIQRQQLLKNKYSNNKAAYQAIRKSLKGLGDPYTRFLDPEEYAELTSQTSGELSGIGIRLGMDKKNQ